MGSLDILFALWAIPFPTSSVQGCPHPIFPSCRAPGVKAYQGLWPPPVLRANMSFHHQVVDELVLLPNVTI